MKRNLLVFFAIALLAFGFTSACSENSDCGEDGDCTCDGDVPDGDMDGNVPDGDVDGDEDGDEPDGDVDGDVDGDEPDGDVDGDEDGDVDGDEDGDEPDGDVDGDASDPCTATQCYLADACVAADTINADHACLICDPASDRFDWTIRAENTVCREGGLCDEAEVCDGLTANCPSDRPALFGTACDDSDNCTANDACDGLGTGADHCVGEAYSCNDHGTCNAADDVCTCDGTFGGDYCDTCAEGYTYYPECRNDLECASVRHWNIYEGGTCYFLVYFKGDELVDLYEENTKIYIYYEEEDPSCTGSYVGCGSGGFEEDGSYSGNWDVLCDGSPDYCRGIEFDDNGYIEREYDDEYCDGADLEYCYLYTHDSDGRELTRGEDNDCDTVLDQNCGTSTYDSETGLLESYTYSHNCGEDDAECTSFGYDEQGRENFQQYDSDCAGPTEPDCRITEYNSDGLIGRYIFDDYCNESPDNCQIYDYDQSGRMVMVAQDTDCDGFADELCYVIEYDDANSKQLSYLDVDCDRANPSNCETLQFDAQGRVTLASYENDCDGNVDFEEEYTYGCD